MSLEKADIKAGTAFEIGSKLEDRLEGLNRELSQLEGAKSALTQAAKALESHQKFVDKDLEDGKLDKEQHNLAKKYVEQCGGLVRNLLVGAEVRIHEARGQVQAMEGAIKVVKQVYDIERTKARALRDEAALIDETASPDSTRPVGRHPGDPLADRRSSKSLSTEEAKTDKE